MARLMESDWWRIASGSLDEHGLSVEDARRHFQQLADDARHQGMAPAVPALIPGSVVVEWVNPKQVVNLIEESNCCQLVKIVSWHLEASRSFHYCSLRGLASQEPKPREHGGTAPESIRVQPDRLWLSLRLDKFRRPLPSAKMTFASIAVKKFHVADDSFARQAVARRVLAVAKLRRG